MCKVLGENHKFKARSGWLLVIGFLFLAACSSPEEKFAEKLMQANVNLEEGSLEKAIDIYNSLQSEHPNHPTVLEGLAIAYSKKQDYITSAFYFSELAEKYPENSEYLLYSAEAFLKGKDRSSAIDSYEHYLLAFPNDWRTWRSLGNIYLQAGQTGNAIHAYQESHKINPQPDLALQAAALANTTGNLRQAEEAFASLLQSQDQRVAKKAHLGYLEIKYKRRQWEEVDKMIAETERRFPGAIDNSALSDVKTAYADWKKAQEEESQAKQEEQDRQKRLLEELNARKRQLELARKQAEERRAAQAAANKPAAESPSDPPKSTPLVATDTPTAPTPQLHDLEEEYPEKQPAETPITQSPSNTPFQEALEAARQFRANDPEAAINKLWEAVNLGDSSGIAFYELAQTYKITAQYTEAEVAALEALRRDKANIRYILLYLDILENTQSPARQVREINRFRTLLPDNPDLILRLARLYAKPGGDRSAARGFYELFLRMAPGHPEADKAQYEMRRL